MNIPEMDCKELVELVTDYFEHTLSPLDHARFEDHLGKCSGCRAYLAQMRTTIQLVGKLTEDHIAPEAKSDLLAVFRDWKKSAE